MNRLLKAAIAVLCLFGITTFARAQLTTITASHISMGGVPIAAGMVTFTPVGNSGRPISFSQGGGGLNAPTAYPCTIASGAITGTCQIPDSALTTPANILYQITVTNRATSASFTLYQVPSITGTTWPLDSYGPPNPNPAIQTVQMSYGTAAAPSPCITPSLYVRNFAGGQLYLCVAGVPVLFSSSVTSSAMQSALSGATGCTTAGNGWNPATNTCTPGGVPATPANSVQINNGGALGPSSNFTLLNTYPIQEYRMAVSPQMSAWNQALANCQNQVVNVGVFGDSTGITYQATGSAGPNNALNRWTEQLRVYLQGRCGAGGTGLVPIVSFLQPGPTVNAQYYSTISGSYTNDASIGPSASPPAGGSYVGTVIELASGSSLTFTTNGLSVDTIKAYCITGTGQGTIAISVDSGAHTGTCGGGSGAKAFAASVSVTAGTAGATHSTTLTCGTGPCGIFGMEGTLGSTGVRFHNMSLSSSSAEWFNAATAFGAADQIAGGLNLVLVNFMTNEPAQGFTTSQFTAALANIYTHEQGTAAKPSVLFYMAGVGNGADSPGQFPTYAAAAKVEAQTLGAAFLNQQDAWGTTFISALFDAGQVHCSDAGCLAQYNTIKAAVIDVEPTLPLVEQNITGKLTVSGCVVIAGQCVATGSASSLIFSAIPAGYSALKIIFSGTESNPTLVDSMLAQLNGDTSGHYDTTFFYNIGAAPTVGGPLTNTAFIDIGPVLPPLTSTNRQATVECLFPNYSGTAAFKNGSCVATGWDTTVMVVETVAFDWQSTAPIASIKIYGNAGVNIVAGSKLAIYGIP